jgi:hypothetical protein
LRKWLSFRDDIGKASRRIVAPQKLRELEASLPWLGGLKGTLWKKNGAGFAIPEGPWPPRAVWAEEQTSREERSEPRRESTGSPASRNRLLMEKARSEAEAKKSGAPKPSSPSRASLSEHIRDLSEVPLEELQKPVAFRQQKGDPSRRIFFSGRGRSSTGNGM